MTGEDTIRHGISAYSQKQSTTALDIEKEMSEDESYGGDKLSRKSTMHLN
jgi:hypothetical protein